MILSKHHSSSISPLSSTLKSVSILLIKKIIYHSEHNLDYLDINMGRQEFI